MLFTTDIVFCTAGLRIPQNELHQILPLGANATVHCLPEPNISLPILSWTIDNSLSYDLHMAFYNSKGIKVHLTADNISYVLVEGRQENSVPGGRRFLCSTIDPDSNNPVVSDTAVVEFYGKLTPVLVECMVFVYEYNILMLFCFAL